MMGWFKRRSRPEAQIEHQPGRVLAAALPANPTQLRQAIDAGEDINGRDEEGMTPLLSAVFIGNIEAVRLLLEVGADPNLPREDDATATPFWHARDDFGLYEIADLLVKAGARLSLTAVALVGGRLTSGRFVESAAKQLRELRCAEGAEDVSAGVSSNEAMTRSGSVE